MNRTELIEFIDQSIRKNEREEITGPVMNQVLKSILENVPMKGESGLTVYDPSMSYSPGATCVYDGQLYLCYSNTTGTFNHGHWQLASAGLVVNSIDQRNALVSRFPGMVVTVAGTQESVRYQLQGGTSNERWRRIGDQAWKYTSLIVQEEGQTTFEVPPGITESRLFLNQLATTAYTISDNITYWQAPEVILETDDTLKLYYKLK
ncbi:MAG: hypothetical protein K9J21_10480 [Bacteroidales bacterium]|nr:hypothetical protein [Bacteroidales bacterium]